MQCNSVQYHTLPYNNTLYIIAVVWKALKRFLNVRCTLGDRIVVPRCQPGGILGETTRAVAHSEASHGPRSPCNSSPLSAQGQCTPCKGHFRKKHLTLCFNNPPRLRSCAVVTTHAPQSYPCFTHVIPLDRTVSPIARPRSGS